MVACSVLHVAPLLGGGVDRHIRDIARGVPRAHLFWHVADAAEVIEDPRARRYFPLADGAMNESLAGWLRGRGVGVVHAHAVDKASRARATWAAEALGAPIIATLHDVLFLRREGLEPGAPRDADPAWLAGTSAFLAGAAARIAPSEYLAALAREHLPGQEIAVVPNGSPPPAPSSPRMPNADYAARALDRVAIVMGAIGPHKGARVLEQAADLLEGTRVGIVVIGYVDAQVDPGWRGPNLYIHGAYDDDQVAALVRAYRGEVALFPNQAPESFSYALSDLWQAGLPAIVPPEGALAERVRRHGAGWLLPEGFGAREVADALQRILSPAAAGELARVKSVLLLADSGRVPPLDAMTRSLDALYARFGLDAGAPVDTQSAPAQELLARNLDGALFRQELARVADELAQVKAGLALEREGAERFAREAREWIAKLERDVADLKASLEAEVNERRRLGEENARLSIHEQALALLPRIIRSRLLKKVIDGRG
jgi:glycosyltransferase involved in cell wall biosynthesis